MSPAPQDSLAAPRGHAGREWFLLAAASVSSVALLFAAWVGVGDPELAGRAELARVASELEASVQHDWDQLRRGSWDWTGQEPVLLAAAPQARAEREIAEPSEASDISLFEALLGEALRLGLQPESASKQLGLVQQALDCAVDPTRMGRARVLAIGLAIEAGDLSLASEHWQRAGEELDGSEAEPEDGIALWLKAALAIEASLDVPQREALLQQIGQLWRSGQLALPPAFDAVVLRADPLSGLQDVMPLRAALRRAVAAASGLGSECFEERLALDRRIALEGLLEPDFLKDAVGLAQSARVGEWDWVLGPGGRGSSGQAELNAWFLAKGELSTKLLQVTEANGVVPADFRLVFDAGEVDAESELLRPQLVLEGSALRLQIYHTDPDSYVSSVQSKRWFLRAGLLLMALFTSAAGLVSFRALRRERRLAGLKSAFVANVSHELRTPIASILLMAENLELGRVPDEAGRLRYTKLIRREAGRLRRLVDDVLDFSRLERGEGLRVQRVQMQLVDFASLLKEDLTTHATGAGGELDFALSGSDVPLQIDAEALRRAALNLVDNALKHSGSERVEVQLEADEQTLRIRVRDHGRGVPAARMASLMEPFERQEHVDAAAGTGLGLSIVREIARAHGGTADLRAPEHGAGLLVELCIPTKGN